MNKIFGIALIFAGVLLGLATAANLSLRHDLDDANAQIKTLLEVQPHYAAGSVVQLEWEGKSWVLKQDEPGSESAQ